MSKSRENRVQANPVDMEPSTRTEGVTIGIELDHEKYQAVADLVEQLTGWVPPTRTGDTLKFTYAFFIDYFGDVERNLDRVLTILGQAETAVVSVDSELIDGASCLIARVVEKLRQIQTMTAPREA